MILEELKIEAKKQLKNKDFSSAVDLYNQLWKSEKNEWNGYFLAQSYRKLKEFESAREIHEFIKKNYPNFKPIKNEKLWLDYDEKIIENWKNPKIEDEARKIIEQADQYDKYTNSIYIKTILKVVKYLLYEKNCSNAFEWLKKMDQSVINNTTYEYNGTIYPADRKIYFINYAEILIQQNSYEDYIEENLSSLGFEEIKLSLFKQKILDKITFSDSSDISNKALAIQIKYFQEESSLRKKLNYTKIYNPEKNTLVSDLSHYEFCPVSFAINETFKINNNTTWEKDEWQTKKKTLSDRFIDYKNKKNIEQVLNDTDIIWDDNTKNDFKTIFESSIIINNAINSKPTVVANTSKTLFGAPDYVFKHPEGYTFSLTEKFSSIYAADKGIPFYSDLVKHYAFIQELKSLNISFGYLLTWYWNFEDNGSNTKKMKVKKYRLFKIELDNNKIQQLQNTIERVHNFKKNKMIEVDANRISFPNKCLNCSVNIYCNHKTGKYTQVKLPYTI